MKFWIKFLSCSEVYMIHILDKIKDLIWNFMYFFTDFFHRCILHLIQRLSLLSGYLLVNSRLIEEFDSEIDSV